MEEGNKRLKDETGKDVLPEITGYQLVDDSGNGYRSDSRVLPQYHYVRLTESKGFDVNTYYPCVLRVANSSLQYRPSRINIFCDFRGSDAVRWSTRTDRIISCNVEFDAVLSRWGGNNAYTFIRKAEFKFCDTSNFCVSRIGQIIETDNVYFYLRGGASYRVVVDAGYRYSLDVYLDGYDYTISGKAYRLSPLHYTDKSITAPQVGSYLTAAERDKLASVDTLPGLIKILPDTLPENTAASIKSYLGVSSVPELRTLYSQGKFFQSEYGQQGIDNSVFLYPSTYTASNLTFRWSGYSALTNSIVVLSVYQKDMVFTRVTYTHVNLKNVDLLPQDLGWINISSLSSGNTEFDRYVTPGVYTFSNANYYGGNTLTVTVDGNTGDVVQTLGMFSGGGIPFVYAVRRRSGTEWGAWNKG